MNIMNNGIGRKSILFPICFVGALLFSLLVQAAIPFLTAPTLGQAIWTVGFSQSFANDSIFSIYARNFGAPEPAAIAFGLSGAWPASIFIRLGMSAIDAYTLMAALWLTVAFFSAYKIGRYLNVSPFLAILGALTWMTMPIIWAHSDYSMVSLGISLLSFYFLATLHLFPRNINVERGLFSVIKKITCYFIVCVVAVFMDGYSFMMFAVGSVLLLVASFYRANKEGKIFLIRFSFPVHFVGILLAYLLYAFFIGKTQFEPSSIDAFRGWGLDVIFMLIPGRGGHWIMDLIGLSADRVEKDFWGDSSVWRTTFCAPLILVAIFSVWKLRCEKKIFLGFALVAVFGTYMALGPSLKFNSKKPEEYAMTRLMPADQGIIPTGTSILSTNVPGFTGMRASYRWLALGVFGAWALSLLLLTAKQRTHKIYGGALLAVVTMLNLPNVPGKLMGGINYRNSFFALEHDVIDNMREVVSPGDKLAFLPWRNDFLVNYAASKLNAIAYNIGGDKNFEEARRHWPDTMRQFRMGAVDSGFLDRIILLLGKKEADMVILPYIDTLSAAHRWPDKPLLKEIMAPVVHKLNGLDMVDIVEQKYFAYVRLSDQWRDRGVLEELCLMPDCLMQNGFSRPFNSKVGVLNGYWLESAGKRGLLHFGPYKSMKSGNYQLVVYGTAKTTGSAWADVASDLGREIHGRFKLAEKDRNSDRILVDAEVTLEHDARGLEVRLYVESEDEVSLHGYLLKRR